MRASRQQYYSFFNPAVIQDCRLWLDAADPATLTFSGNQVLIWADKSGNGSNAVQLTGSGATYSSNALVFAGSIAYDTGLSSVISTAQTRFVVGQHSATGTGPYWSIGVRVISGTPAGYVSGISSLKLQMSTQSGTSVSAGNLSPNVPTNSNYIMTTTVLAPGSPGTNLVISNSTQAGSNPANSPSLPGSGTFLIGGNQFANFWIGRISEVLIYSRTLLSTERQQIEAYLAYKWGIIPSLNTGNPYRTQVPLLLRPLVPSDVGQFALWLDAADTTTITSTSGYVTQWRDKSGFGRHASNIGTGVVSGGTTLNGLNTIRFASGSSLSISPAFAMDSVRRTGFVVYKFTSNVYPSDSAFYQQFFVNGSNTLRTFQFMITRLRNTDTPAYGWLGEFALRGTGVAPSSSPNAFFQGAAGPTNQAFMLTIQRSLLAEGGGRVRFTGSNTPSFTSNTPSNWSSAGALGIGEGMSNTQIAELLLFSGSTLTTSQIERVEGYLAWKWGLQTSLPTNHAYYKYPPLAVVSF